VKRGNKEGEREREREGVGRERERERERDWRQCSQKDSKLLECIEMVIKVGASSLGR